MTAKFLALVLVIGLANTCVVQAQVAVPGKKLLRVESVTEM
jgi:hypothetical protein